MNAEEYTRLKQRLNEAERYFSELKKIDAMMGDIADTSMSFTNFIELKCG